MYPGNYPSPYPGAPYAAAPQPTYLPTPPYGGQYPAAPIAPPQYAGNPGMTLPAAPPAGSSWQSTPPQPASPVLAVQAAGQQQPKLRGSIPDAPPPAPPAPPRPIRLPSPNDLGLAMPTSSMPMAMTPVSTMPVALVPPATPTASPIMPIPNVQKAAIDWNQTLARFERLGVQGFHLDHLPTGGVRATLILPSNRPFEATGASDADAVTAVLRQAEEVARR